MKRLSNFIVAQIKIVKALNSMDYDIVVFFPQIFILVILFLKFKHKTIIFWMGGRASSTLKYKENFF